MGRDLLRRLQLPLAGFCRLFIRSMNNFQEHLHTSIGFSFAPLHLGHFECYSSSNGTSSRTRTSSVTQSSVKKMGGLGASFEIDCRSGVPCTHSEHHLKDVPEGLVVSSLNLLMTSEIGCESKTGSDGEHYIGLIQSLDELPVYASLRHLPVCLIQEDVICDSNLIDNCKSCKDENCSFNFSDCVPLNASKNELDRMLSFEARTELCINEPNFYEHEDHNENISNNNKSKKKEKKPNGKANDNEEMQILITVRACSPKKKASKGRKKVKRAKSANHIVAEGSKAKPVKKGRKRCHSDVDGNKDDECNEHSPPNKRSRSNVSGILLKPNAKCVTTNRVTFETKLTLWK